MRPYAKPTDLFVHLERLENATGFAIERIQAEKRTRKRLAPLEDITFDEIYAEIHPEFRHLKTKELALEKQVLHPNPEIQKLWNHALLSEKKVVIVSDMYLSEKFLSEVLQEKGFAEYTRLYVSSETRKTKASGTMYRQILDDFGVKPEQVLHIGDNHHSDYKQAMKQGIHAVHYPKVIDRLFEEYPRAVFYHREHENSLGASIVLGLAALSYLYPSENYWHQLGFTFAGPTILAYVKWLDERFKKDGITDALFVARDGYSLQKAFEILKTSDIKSHYVYASRFLNLIINLDYEDKYKISKEVAFSDIRAIIEYFRQQDADLDKDAPSKIETAEQGIAFIEKHRGHFTKLANEEKQNYQRYFDSLQTGDMIAVVDTVTGSLMVQKLISSVAEVQKMNGYYWQTHNGVHRSKLHRVYVFGEVDNNQFDNWNLIEFWMTAPTPSIRTVCESNPVFEDATPEETTRMEAYKDVFAGIMEFIELAKTVFGPYRLGLCSKELVDWNNVLTMFPSREDTVHLSTLKHASDANHTIYIPLMQTKDDVRIVKKKKVFGVTWLKTIESSDTKSYYLLKVIPIAKTIRTIHGTKRYILSIPVKHVRR